MITDLPNEYYLSSNKKSMHFLDQNMYINAIKAEEKYTWGLWQKLVNFEGGPPRTITLVTLLRSVCRKFKRCIDQNSVCRKQALKFVRRDYLINSKIATITHSSANQAPLP